MSPDRPLSDQNDLSPGGCELTILMPCLNEAETLGVCIDKARAYLEASNINGEVLIADNGSDDGSRQIALDHGAEVVPVPRKGYGAALMGGIAAARGRYVIMGDADDSYDFSALDHYVEQLRAGHDLVMGNRFQGGIAPGAMPPLHRYLGNPVLSWIGRRFFRIPIGDFHCGLRGFRRDAIRGLRLNTPGMEFASEMVVKASLRKLKIAEVPTTLSPDGRSRPPHLRSWRDGWRHLRFLLLFSPRWLFLYPGLVLMFLGLGSMAWLIDGPGHVGSLTLGVNTLVYSAAALVCGFQAVAFAVFVKVYAMKADLLPEDQRISRLVEIFSIEFGIVLGILSIAGGLIASAFAVGLWSVASFGPLNPDQTLRIVIPAATALVLGLQILFSSFFLGFLTLKTD